MTQLLFSAPLGLTLVILGAALGKEEKDIMGKLCKTAVKVRSCLTDTLSTLTQIHTRGVSTV
jgi:hypothetical protein